MINITPIDMVNRVRLFNNVPLDNTYEHTILFANSTTQYQYFDSKMKHEFNDLTPIVSITGSVMLDINPYEIMTCNYMAFKNASFSEKWFYAFITEVIYDAPSCAIVHYEIDVLQSWLFDFTWKESFIAREHVSDDTIGKNLVEEGLDTGEYVTLGKQTITELSQMSIVMAISPDSADSNYYGGLYGGIYSGVQYINFPSDDGGVGALNDIIQTIVTSGHGSRILSIFMCPTFLITEVNSSVSTGTTSISKPTYLQGYLPQNNKLYTFPFSFLQVSTPNGSAIYKFEYSSDASFQFEYSGDYSISPTVYLTPKNYLGETKNYDKRLALGNYPLCSWNNDTFGAWIAQNRNSMVFQTLGSLGALAGGIASGNLALAGGGITSLVSQMASYSDKATQAVEATKGNIGGGGSALAIGIQNFFFETKSCKLEFLQRIDKFFTLYGYKVNEIKVPNLHTRPNWNYLQTINCNIVGNIPFNHISKIKSIFNNGVTLWHTTDVGNYSLDNTI